MWILPLVGYAGSIFGFCFLTMAIASGLYYLSELVEENTVIAKRLLTRLVYVIMGIHLLLWVVDGLSFWATMLGITCHLVYLGNMRKFPFVKLSDPLFIMSCILVLADHYVWFKHFSSYQTRAFQRSSYYDDVDVPTFTQIASYFGLCVWLVPFSLFVSLSAGDNVLPTIGTEPIQDSDGKAKHQGMFKAIVDSARGMIGESLSGMERP
ncbi:Transmembrane adaptor Erv26 [Geosmithia morbida]|uniref:Transmembrane adaptor Erv26 n=1 Tax=Geosmithia morbida TaxID=1094350 RepID=A0A9P5D7W1_9HYPO|nr:Transmembrane adaptor Erv26 [Geosmithia morbida]KAF4127036.1 Transmembrane adaptor Erv26 [Geosmithia morbida]